MTSLKNYDLIVKDVFYRSWHILDYIEKNPQMSDLDREAIKATIMDALVYKKLIDPKKQSLDLDNLCICDNLNHYCYEEKPFVTSIPLDIKEKMRKKSFHISGGLPASVFYAKPAGSVSFCIYDMNTVFSAFFDEFTFIDCDYNSPTRGCVIAEDRPFIEVTINGTKYLVDALTKRIFNSEQFRKRYNLIEKHVISKKDFNERQKQLYKEDTEEYINYASQIAFFDSFGLINKGSMSEMAYEYEKSKEIYPEQFEEAEEVKKEMANFSGIMFTKKIT